MQELKKQKLTDAFQRGMITDEKTLSLWQILSDAQDEMDRMERLKDEINADFSKIESDIRQLILDTVKKVDDKLKEVKDGKDYVLTESDKKQIASKIIVPVVEKIIERTEVVKEQPIVTNEIKEVAKYKTPEEIRDDLENLGEGQRLSIQAIEDLPKMLEELRKLIPTPRGSAGAGFAKIIRFVDNLTPTGTINGSNTVFTIARAPESGTLKVYLNGARQRVTTDYTLSAGDKTITFVSAPLTGSILLVDFRY